MGWRDVQSSHGQAPDDPWWRRGDPWQAAGLCAPRQAAGAKVACKMDGNSGVANLPVVAQTAYAIMLGLAHGVATRQVVAAASAAVVRSILHDKPSDNDVIAKPSTLEYMLQEVVVTSGHDGLGELKRSLMQVDRKDLANRLSKLNVARRSSAHPDVALAQEISCALTPKKQQEKMLAELGSQVAANDRALEATLHSMQNDTKKLLDKRQAEMDKQFERLEQLLEEKRMEQTESRRVAFGGADKSGGVSLGGAEVKEFEAENGLEAEKDQGTESEEDQEEEWEPWMAYLNDEELHATRYGHADHCIQEPEER